MAAINPYPGHSADVRMHLLLNGHALRIAQMGPNFLLLDDTAEHPPANAEIVLSIDGQVERWIVRLPIGLHSGQKHVLISKGQFESGTVEEIRQAKQLAKPKKKK